MVNVLDNESLTTLTVDLGDRSYPIFIGASLIDNRDYLVPYLKGESALIVSNETVAPLYLDRLSHAVSGIRTSHLILKDGEQYKSLDTVNEIFTHLLQNRFDRQSTLIALGGGVVGDIVGFAAACYQRGINFIQVPTTLLAQVDSSVGGKTGVNHALGKNMIGAFFQPSCVVADTGTLNTLEDRQLSAGLAEVIKYGLIGDLEFFEWIESNIASVLERDTEALTIAIERSCRNKASVVAADEREGGIRALLNLGHTFGHAIETAMGYGNWLHGEAVAAGTCMAARLSRRMGWLTEADVERIVDLFERARLPTTPPKEIGPMKFMGLMSVDKKVMDSVLHLVLLKRIGEAVVTSEFDTQTLESCVREG